MQGDETSIAVIGMACRFPGAPDVEQYGRNLRSGRESIVFMTPDEIEAPWRSLAREPGFVAAAAILDDCQLFDRELFGMTEREALLADPQHRLFLQAAWEALEDGGYGGAGDRHGPVAVYAGSWLSSYAARAHALCTTPDEEYLCWLLNAPDFLTTYASYKLDLTGESLAVQCACSSSLVAVHMACQSLLAGRCDMALAGGVAIDAYQRVGYLYRPGHLLSPDGHCRPFDRAGRGTVPGHGLGLVLLKRLPDAVRDGDPCHAIIRASAAGNDGHRKIGLQAPSLDGLTEVAATAITLADVDPDQIGFVETHGGGTEIGDALEVEALTRAFATSRRQYCLVGSVKSNMGDLVQAGGIAGLMKAILAVRNGEIPPTLHFQEANPRIDFPSTPFRVSAELLPWDRANGPRIAGVAASGIGGTNGFVVVEQPPRMPERPVSRRRFVVPLSAGSDRALEEIRRRLAAWLDRHPDSRIGDIAFTLSVGRAQLSRRTGDVAGSTSELLAALSKTTPAPATASDTDGELEQLRAAWCHGADLDWRKQFIGEPVRRVSLPTYPFERDPYWIDAPSTIEARGFIPWMASSYRTHLS